jgi:hypothetical protein
MGLKAVGSIYSLNKGGYRQKSHASTARALSVIKSYQFVFSMFSLDMDF